MVQILQGLNLESEITTTKIKLEGEDIGSVSEILDKIASFHPIFIDSYDISPTLLTIRSKLPFLWRESAETLNNLSKQEVSIKEASLFVIDTIINKRIKSMSTISLLQSCINKSIEITPSILEYPRLEDHQEGFDNSFNRYLTLGCGRGSHITASASSTKDAHMAQKFQRDKWATNTFIERMQLPLPKWDVLKTKKDIEKLWDTFEKPVVIKPTGLTAGKGVTVGIDSIEKANKAFDYALKMIDEKNRNAWQRKIMIQEQVQGEDYRLLVINGKLQITTKRIPAFVVGDGKSSIEKLIEKENEDPRRDLSNPAHILKPIRIDEPLLNYLKDQQRTLKDIPQKDEKIPVRKVASMSQGGITEDFTDSISEEIKTIVESISQSVHAFTLGVDVMCKDISKPLTKDNGAILEINTMPETYLNLYPVLGEQRGYVADIYIDELLKENSCKRDVLVGQSKDDLPTLLRKKRKIGENEYVGEIIDGKYLINGMEMDSQAHRWQHTQAIKCNGALDTILLHYRDWSEVKEQGLGFDYIDTLYITKELSNSKEEMKIVKKYKRKGLIDKIKIV
jgi:D-alanine-D-alanine ligase-like ATP-grasp enzyme